jgi:hypothetical protein
MARRLEFLIVIAVAWALFVAVTGGIDLRAIGVPFRSRNPQRATLLAVALALVYFGRFRARALQRILWLETVLRPSLARLASVVDRRPGVIAWGLALITFVVGVRGVGPRQRFALGLLAAFVVSVWLGYLCYLPFEAWWTLRFLLPAFPPMLILSVIGWRVALGWLRPTYRRVALGGIVLAVIAAHVRVVQREAVLGLWRGESDYVSAGSYLRRELPANAVVVSMLHSGSLRLYSGRLTLRYDWLPGMPLSRVVRVLTKRGYRPYILLAAVEEEPFRARFRLSDAADAPGTVIAVLERSGIRARLYDPLRQAGPIVPVTMPMVVPRLCTGCR